MVKRGAWVTWGLRWRGAWPLRRVVAERGRLGAEAGGAEQRRGGEWLEEGES